ncbi:precorrin-2 dehydrogenase/sirohydrochlorin ferrochelatase family protein [Photobacterium lutimaris]|uniref:precorrin-2 dehydrogenase n=1 Tax=Photobacterium lutimaris TaxID=388278 RepID=A0A2T3J4A7_9GAMM|nr:bifunctional precorrin-2 dehydrogenase/sirohydrochlorin ferrochelatase [Photobacterium lutimaris]PSU36105.1 siroheme synthase [Photobacterium lutimaris]TDR79211.1 precorrin-2 dehydrogenase [Photobacterium lutimaris]
MDYFPIFLSVKQKKVTVVGGGDVACRKVDLLRKAGAIITVISPKLHNYLAALSNSGDIRWKNKCYEKCDLQGSYQVWATTNNSSLNHQVHQDATKLGIWINVVDDKDYCDFITPSIIDRSPIQVAVSSGGASPVLVRYLREKLETQLPHNLSLLARYAGAQRERIKQHFATVDERRKFWERFFRHPEVEQAQRDECLERVFVQLINQADINKAQAALYLIETGADTELLTLKALRLMQQAEYVLYPSDAGADDDFVDLCRRDADREPYNDTGNLTSQVQCMLDEGLRVCILAPKDKATEVLKPLEQSFSGLYIPCL